METIKFKLDAFEGPLDVLLHLVSKHKLNIYDIEISLLLEQYLEFMDAAEKLDYELAADFFEMAARLIYIKTCYLLPQPEEAEELKKELQGRMIEYSLCKLAAARLRDSYAGGLVFVREPVKLPVNKQYTRLHDKQELYDAYMAIFSKVKNYTPLRANMFSPIVSKRVVSVESKITYVLERLYSDGHFDMSSLYDGMTDRSERIATFLAVLEMAKSGRIYLNEDNTVISLRLDKPDDDDEASEQGENEAAEEIMPEESSAAAEISDKSAEDASAADDAEEYADIPDEILADDAVTENIEAEEDIPAELPEKIEVAEAASEDISAADGDVDELSEEIPEERAEAPEKEIPRAKAWSVQLALGTHTASLRLPSIEAVPAYAEVSVPEEVSNDVQEDTGAEISEAAEEAVKTELACELADNKNNNEEYTEEADNGEIFTEPEAASYRPNYFGCRYYWSSPHVASQRRDYRAAWLLRL